MFSKKYKLNDVSLNDNISKVLLYRLNEEMDRANHFGKNYFEYGFGLNYYIKTSVFSGVESIQDLKHEIGELPVIRDLTLICNSRHWPIVFYVEGNSSDKAILQFRIGGK